MYKMTIQVVITENEKGISVSSDIKGDCTSTGLSKGLARLLYGIEESTNVSVINNALEDYTRMREENEE